MRREVRRNRVGCAFHRWYTPGTGRYSRPDPVNIGVLGSATRPRDLPLDPISAYYLAMLRTGSPKLEQPYLYGAQNPVLYLDPLGLFGPGALATAGGACIAADGPIPAGDVVGVPLLIVAGGWAATEVIKDWWDNREPCEECEARTRDICKRLLVLCLKDPFQPEWNKPNYGPRKDCGACFRSCVNNGGVWPFEKCPLGR